MLSDQWIINVILLNKQYQYNINQGDWIMEYSS